MLKRIYHLTTRTRYESIQSQEVLRALSDPWFDWSDYDGSLSNVVRHEKYLVGIPEGKITAWRRYGAMKELEKYICDGGLDMKSSGKPSVMLSIPVIKTDGFVREFKFRTPRYMNSVYPDLYYLVCEAYRSHGMNDLTDEQHHIYKELVRKSMFSAVKLGAYDNSFDVPEVWLPQDTPTGLIQVVSQKLKSTGKDATPIMEATLRTMLGGSF